MVSVRSASCYIKSASRYHPCYQRRFSMYIRGLIPRNFAELAEAVPIDTKDDKSCFFEEGCILIMCDTSMDDYVQEKNLMILGYTFSWFGMNQFQGKSNFHKL